MKAISLTELDLASIRAALLAPGSQELIDYMFAISLRRDTAFASVSTISLATAIGWVTDGGRRLTEVGGLVADPLREYKFWVDRDRRLHAESEFPYLAAKSYAGKSVLEVGSGFGCNLLSLSMVRGKFVGVEPVLVYRQLAPILAEREGLDPPIVVDGSGEDLPFGDEEFDVVLCYSAHQYMNIKKALAEMARVLRRGGELQIIGGCLGSYIAVYLSELVQQRSLRGVRGFLRTVTNTISYSVLGRRTLMPVSVSATAAPIYPRRASMEHWIRQCGLALQVQLCCKIDVETCFIARKAR